MTREIGLREDTRGFKVLDHELGMPLPVAHLWSIVEIRFGHLQGWPLELTLERGENLLRIVFRSVVSFRAHDESGILGHWAMRGSERIGVGSIYPIAESAYLNELSTGMSAIVGTKIDHYLIAGYDLCVEVLATNPPEVVPNFVR